MDLGGLGVALVVATGIGYVIAEQVDGSEPGEAAPGAATPEWWNIRQSLTGTQLRILQYMEAKKEVFITGLLAVD